MNKYAILILLLAAAALICVSCVSTPNEPEPEIPAQPVQPPAAPVQTVENTVQQADAALGGPMSRAQAARQRAVDFDSHVYFPSDWEAAESQYQSVSSMPRTSAGEIAQIVSTYNSAADSYDAIFERTIPLYAQAREDEIMSSRDTLISSGLPHQYPQVLQNADEIAITALEQYEADDYYAARDTAARALDEYETLNLGARLLMTRQEIVDRGFADFDSENFSRADDVAQTAIDEHEAGNNEAAVENAEEALLRYNLVLSNGWTSYAGSRRVSVSDERELALAERANIAARETFREGESLYSQAEEAMAAENYNEASALFTNAETYFVVARQETEEKRIRAMEAIRIAEERIEESSGTAIEAERIIEGGSR